MDARLACSTHDMASGSLLALRDASGWVVVSERGPAWLTLEGYSQDKWLSAGERFVVPGPGLMLVQAEGASRIRLEPPPPGILGRLALGGRGMLRAAAQASLYAAERMKLLPSG